MPADSTQRPRDEPFPHQDRDPASEGTAEGGGGGETLAEKIRRYVVDLGDPAHPNPTIHSCFSYAAQMVVADRDTASAFEAIRARLEGVELWPYRLPNAHGFGLVDPAETAASAGQASYYAFSPRPGIRMVSINTDKCNSPRPDTTNLSAVRLE